MKFGASTFLKNIEILYENTDSIEYYIPKLELYDNGILKHDRIEELLDIRYSYDLECTMHSPYYPNSYSEYPEDLVIDLTDMSNRNKIIMKEVIDLAVRFDSTVLTVHPGRIHNNNPKKSLEKMIENLKYLVQYAMDVDITIGIENKESTDNLNLGTTPNELINIIEKINSENLGIVFDIGHANLSCSGNQLLLSEFYNKIEEHIIHTHIHDNFGINGEFYGDLHLCPGNGNINFNILNSLIKEDIIFNFELFNINDIINGKKYILNLLNIKNNKI